MVRAEVIQIAPRISGPLVHVPIRDNGFVRRGDLLFEIDPRTFRAAVEQARANLDRVRDEVVALEQDVAAGQAVVAQYEAQLQQARIAIDGYTANEAQARADYTRTQELANDGFAPRQQLDARIAALDIAVARLQTAQSLVIQMTAGRAQARANLARAVANLGAPGEQNAQIRAAAAAVQAAELNLEFTRQIAPVDGYVTNVQVRMGDSVVANQPVLALIDSSTFYVQALFRETLVGGIRPGDRAIVTLMSYPDRALEARVDSVGWGIAIDDGRTGFELLPAVSPTFDWIRLAQRIPIRIRLEPPPNPVQLRIGATASILVMTGTGESGRDAAVPPMPRALQ